MRFYTLAEYREALFAVDPGIERTAWVEVAMAAKAAGLTLDDFIEWSRKGGNFGGEADCRAVWRSISPDGSITPGTLIHWARQYGWTPPADAQASGRPHHPKPPRPARPAEPVERLGSEDRDTPEPEERKPDPQMLARAQALIDAAVPVERTETKHPYLVRKGILGYGLLEIPSTDAVRIIGYHPKAKDAPLVDGRWLVAPLVDADGHLGAVELIDEAGKKVGLKGLPRAGLYWGMAPMAELSDWPRLGVAEGIATAASIQELTDFPVFAAGSKANLKHVAQLAAERAPGAEIVVFGDLGKDSEKVAREAARDVFGACVVPDPALPEGSDFNDMLLAQGEDATRTWLERAMHGDSGFSFVQAITRGKVEIDFVLPGLPRGQVGLIVGPGSVGKTYLMLELAASIAIGRSLAGLPGEFARPKRGRVAVLCGEDSRDIIHNRLVDMAEAYGLSPQEAQAIDRNFKGLSLIGEDMRIVQMDNRIPNAGPFLPRLRRLCHGRRAVFIDPLARLHDADENDNTAASQFMLALTRIADETGCAIILLHHVGKGDRADWAAARGASAITTNARWQWNLSPATANDDRIPAEERWRWVKCVGVKINYGRSDGQIWLRRNENGVLLHADPDDALPPLPVADAPKAPARQRGQVPPGYRPGKAFGLDAGWDKLDE